MNTDMKFVMFLMFIETAAIPIAEYKTFADCNAVRVELEEEQTQASEQVEDLLTSLADLSSPSYKCVPVPESYDWDK